jgi:hypothetical protein
MLFFLLLLTVGSALAADSVDFRREGERSICSSTVGGAVFFLNSQDPGAAQQVLAGKKVGFRS